MSVANVVSGFAVGGALIHLAINVAFPVPPIVVHSLNYKEGKIHQDRTVTADGDFFAAEWRATIFDADTSKPIAGCAGRDFWNYASGRTTAQIPLHEWVGQEGCTPEYLRMIGGEFYAVASWHWGNDQTPPKIGPNFRP